MKNLINDSWFKVIILVALICPWNACNSDCDRYDSTTNELILCEGSSIFVKNENSNSGILVLNSEDKKVLLDRSVKNCLIAEGDMGYGLRQTDSQVVRQVWFDENMRLKDVVWIQREDTFYKLHYYSFNRISDAYGVKNTIDTGLIGLPVVILSNDFSNTGNTLVEIRSSTYPIDLIAVKSNRTILATENDPISNTKYLLIEGDDRASIEFIFAYFFPDYPNIIKENSWSYGLHNVR